MLRFFLILLGSCKEKNATSSCLNMSINRPFDIRSVVCSSNCTMNYSK